MKTIRKIIVVSDYGTDIYGRDQARKLLSTINGEKIIVLNFKKVNFIGNSFADEIFRVFRRSNPGKKVEYISANDNVEFMIKRALANNMWE